MFEERSVRGRVAVMATWQMWSSAMCFALGLLIPFLTGQPEGLFLSVLAAGSLWWWYPIYRASRTGPTVPQGPSVDDLVAEAEADLKAGRINRTQFRTRVRAAWRGHEG